MYSELLVFAIIGCRINFAKLSPAMGKNAKLFRQIAIPHGYTPFPQFHVAYKLYEIPSTWHDALTNCFMEFAQLAIVDTWSKVSEINKLRTRKSEQKWLHVGVYWSRSKSAWVTVDTDEPAESLPWAPGEPDKSGECAGIDTDEREGDDEGLVDYNCYRPNEFYVCELPLLK